MKKFIHAILSLIKTIGIVCLWCLLTALIAISLSKLEKEHYTPTDTPNERFMVIATDTDNGYYRQTWQEYQINPKPPLTTPDKNCVEDCLKILDNGNYLYINDSPLIITKSEYQIKDGKVIPISFKTYHLGHIFVGMIGAFFVMGFLKYLIRIFQIRKDKQAMINYHKKLAENLLIACAVLGIFWAVIYLTV
ncbi:Uncharacterised protein [Moraxella caprae]|uniref:Uncharacterized protein n=1 Tax=Moraxella caprae TaxID=90240 RepID=A0A378R2L3_9GAMM|nr:hypothetical protein [Moraxella caprae]STZ09009.1 Uncharacterised protein [Moraxella caprae]